MKIDLLWSAPVLVAFDGEGDGGGAGDAGDGGAGGAAGGAAGAAGGAAGGAGKPDDGAKVFTQKDVNRYLAEDRRKGQAAIAALEAQYKAAIEDKNLSDSARTQLQESLESFQAQYRTKEENLKHEHEKLKAETSKTMKALAEERDSWKNRFETTEVRRAIQDAANKGEAYRSDHILAILQPMTKMVPVLDVTGKPTGELAPRVHYPSVDAKTNEPLTVVITADEAVSAMKQKTEEYGYLFKSTAQGGVGGSSGTGSLKPGAGGRVDVSKLTPSQYRELRKSNPEALGLR